MKVIIAPTDFSTVASNAVNYAAEFADNIQASLALIHVCQLPLTMGEVPVAPFGIEEMIAEAESNIQRVKRELEIKIKGAIKIYTEVRIGILAHELESYCDRLKPYAVVMGSHGAGAVERFFLGSNTITAMKYLTCPLIVVPVVARFRAIRNIGLACDFKHIGDTTPTDEIRNLVKDFHATLHIIYVHEKELKEYKPALVTESGILQEMLGDLNPKYRFITYDDINEGLNEYAVAQRLDLLIVVPKRHDLVERLFNKSHSKRLVLHTNVPLMSVHE